jgi:hypothetical protein
LTGVEATWENQGTGAPSIVPQPPETRETLIRRLPDAADVEAWDEFVAIYEPLLFRLARGRGMQPADAEDFVQEVLTAVARNIGRRARSRGHVHSVLHGPRPVDQIDDRRERRTTLICRSRSSFPRSRRNMFTARRIIL